MLTLQRESEIFVNRVIKLQQLRSTLPERQFVSTLNHPRAMTTDLPSTSPHDVDQRLSAAPPVSEMQSCTTGTETRVIETANFDEDMFDESSSESLSIKKCNT